MDHGNLTGQDTGIQSSDISAKSLGAIWEGDHGGQQEVQGTSSKNTETR
jgi:hypothetical protein